MQSAVQHLFVFLQVHFQLFVTAILTVNWSDVLYVTNLSVIVLLKLTLVGLDLLS